MTATKILNVDLTEANLVTNKQWFNQSTIDTIKSADPDVVTIQSLLSANSTQDLIYLFGHSYQFLVDKESSPCSAILWRKDRFKAKEVDIKSMSGLEGLMSSTVMCHLWSTKPGQSTSLTIVSWAPNFEAEKRDIGDKRRLKMLDDLINFLGNFRKTLNVKMRIVVGGNVGANGQKMNWNKYPFFKIFNLVNPTHPKSDIFVSPFIFTADCLQAVEMPVPNAFPHMSNKNVKMIATSGLQADQAYIAQHQRTSKVATNSSQKEDRIDEAQSKHTQNVEKQTNFNENQDERNTNLLDKVAEAFQFTSLRKQVREDKAYQKAIARNKNRTAGSKPLEPEPEPEIFPVYVPKKKGRSKSNKRAGDTSGLSSATNESSLIDYDDEPTLKARHKLYPTKSNTTLTTYMTVQDDDDGMPRVESSEEKVARQREFMMDYMARKSPRHGPIRQELTTYPLHSATPSRGSSMSALTAVDFRRKITDLSPLHQPKQKHAPY